MRPPAANTVRILTGNVDSGNPKPKEAVNTAVATGAHSIGWNEGKNLVEGEYFRRLNDYRDLTARGMGFEIPGDANDCPMLIRKDLHVTHFSMTKACDAIPNSKVAHARTFSMVGYDVRGWDQPFFHIEIHPNWIQKIRDGLIVDRYIDSMQTLNGLILFAKMHTDYFGVSGDFNITLEESRNRDHVTAHKMCTRHHMGGRAVHLNAVYWSPALELKRMHKISKRFTLSDHPYWLVADLKRK